MPALVRIVQRNRTMVAGSAVSHLRRSLARRIMAIAGVVFCAIPIAIVGALHTPPGRRFVLSQVTQLLGAQQIELHTGDLRYNLFDLSLAVSDLRVRSTRTPEVPPFVFISKARLGLSLLPLLRGRYEVESGMADGVYVHYFVDQDGNDNVPRPLRRADEPAEPLDYLIASLRASDAHVRYENRARDVDVTLPIVRLEVNGNGLTDRHVITLQGANGVVRAERRNARIDRVSGSLELGENDLRVERLDVETEGSRLSLSGTIEDFDDDPQADLALHARIDAARAAAAARLDEKINGTIEFDATAKGDLAAPVLQARVRGSEMQFRNVDRVHLAATVAYDIAEKYLQVTELDLRSPLGTMMGQGSVAVEGARASQVHASISALDAAPLMRAFDLPYAVASRIDARIEATWPGLDYMWASGSANATLTTTRSGAARSVLPASGRLAVNAGNGRIIAALNRLRIAGADVNGRVTLLERRQLDGNVQTHIRDVGPTIANVEAFLGRKRGSLVPLRVNGSLGVQSRVSGTIQSPAVAAHLTAPALALGGAHALAMDGNVAYAPAGLTVDRLDLVWQEARARAEGRIGLRGARPIELRVDASSLDISELLMAVDQTGVPVTGMVSLHGAATGTLARPAATATVQASNLSAYNELLGTLDASATMVGDDVNVTSLVLNKPQPGGDGRLTLTGSYNLNRGSYTFDLGSTNLRLVSASLPDGRPLRADITVSATGAGTTRAPMANANLAVNGMRVGEYDLGAVLTDAVVVNQQATIKLAAERFSLNAHANIGIQRPYEATMNVEVDDLDLATVPLNLQTPLEGRLRASVDAEGELTSPERGRATANIQAFSGFWSGQPFDIRAPVPLRYTDERLQIDRLSLAAQDSSLVVSGELPLTPRAGEGTLEVQARADLGTLAKYAPAGTNVSGDGAALLTGTIRGTLKAIDPDLVVTIDNASLRAPQIEPGISNLQVRARVAGGEANIEQLTANWGPARVDASGRVPLDVLPQLPIEIRRTSGPASFKASVQDFDPGTLPGAPAGLSGRIALEAQLEATRADLAALQGRVTFPELQLAFSGLTLTQPQPSAVAIANGAAEIESFELSGTAGAIAAHGTVGLVGQRALDVRAGGNLNVAAVSVFTDTVRAEGQTTIDLAARGTMSSPELHGSIDVADATVVLDDPNIAAESLNARVDLEGRRITMSRLTADVNGGTVEGTGFVTLGDAGVRDVDLQFSAKDFAFNEPLELRSLSDANVRVTGRGEEILVDGQVTITEAGLTGDVKFDRGLLASIAEPRKLDFTEPRSSLLERVRFNINVDTATPILLDNNIARAEVTTDLRVLGTPYEPGLAGRLTVLEGGELTLNERRYEVQRGVITFVDERRIFPSFDLSLSTSVRNHDITVAVTGTPDDTETILTADPELPEPDIMAMLVTGRTLDEMRGEEFDVAREQVLSYLTGRVGSRLGRGVERATGLSEVRIEPSLIANEADPTARLTVGQELTEELQLVYSTNLTDSNDQIWVAEYDISRRFQTRAVRQSDNTYRLDFHHDVSFGGRPAPRRQSRQRPRVTRVDVAGDAAADEPIRKLFRIEAGDEFDFFAARRGVRRIEEFYIGGDRLQSRVRLDREPSDNGVSVRVRVTRGPKVDLRFVGANPPSNVVDDVRRQWHHGVFDRQRADDSTEALRAWLMRDDYLQANVTYAFEDVTADERRVVFRIEPGPRFRTVILAFEGASGIEPKELDQIIKEQKLERQLFTDPKAVTELLKQYYREQGYLIADVSEPRYEFEALIARVILTVSEGPRFTVRDVRTTGNSVLESPRLVGELPVVIGDPFLPAAAENALQRIHELYWQRGYNDVRADYKLTLDRAAGQVDVTFSLQEGARSVVADIAIEGNDKTSDRLVREQLELVPQQALDLSALSRSRRNLYDTNAFSVVDVTREELEGDLPASPPTAPQDPRPDTSDQKPVRIHVSVREVQPIQLRYGASYDTERGPGGLLDLSNHNSLGKAREVGLRSRYDRQLREARLYMTQPSLRYWPIELTGTVFYREERNPLTEITNPFNVDRHGLSLQGETQLGDSYVWSYGYRFERAHTFDPSPGGLLNRRETVSPLTSTFTREARDEVLDATTGSFMSQAFAYSPSWLGSDLPFLKYFGQYFHYVPLQPPRRKPFTNEILKPRFVYATGVRMGLARGIGDVSVPQSERFFAGGATTLRGFAQNAVGPIGADRLPTGGEALLVINNELRFPLVSIVDGVVFSDIGNVFGRIADFSLTDLRKSAGLGLRLRTPWILVRADYGVVLDQRPGERRSRFYFSIGQAF